MLASRSVVHELPDHGAEKWKFRIAGPKAGTSTEPGAAGGKRQATLTASTIAL